MDRLTGGGFAATTWGMGRRGSTSTDEKAPEPAATAQWPVRATPVMVSKRRCSAHDT